VKGYKKPSAAVFMSSLNLRLLTFGRSITWLEEIQKKNPSFNYNEDDQLKSSINILEQKIQRLKEMGVKLL
jgi:hypothetical protein